MTPLPGWPGENRWLGPLSWYWLRWGETSSPQGSPKKDGVHYSFKKITFHLKSLSASLHLEGQGLDRFEVPHVFRIGASWIVLICFDSGVNLLPSGSATETSQFPIIAGAPFQDGHDELMLTEYVVTRYYRAPEAQSQALERFTSPPFQSLELGQVVLTASKYTYATALRCCIFLFFWHWNMFFFSRSWMGMRNNCRWMTCDSGCACTLRKWQTTVSYHGTWALRRSICGQLDASSARCSHAGPVKSIPKSDVGTAVTLMDARLEGDQSVAVFRFMTIFDTPFPAVKYSCLCIESLWEQSRRMMSPPNSRIFRMDKDLQHGVEVKRM